MKRFVAVLLLPALLFAACGSRPGDAPEEVPAMTTSPVEEEEEPEAPPEPVVQTARLTVVGDIMCHDYQYKEAYDPETGAYDFSHNFQDMKPYFEQADLVIGNLETVFAGEEIGYSDFPLFNSPDAFLYAVKEAGFDLLTTANNHCLDKGAKGVERTIALMNDLGLDHIGTYRSPEEKSRIYTREVNGITLAVLAYSYGFNGNRVPEDYMVSLLDEETVRADIAKAKALDPDLIVVLPHLGNEYETYTRDVFKTWTDMMFDAGADLVLCSHPHVLQPMEYKDLPDGRRGFVIYSLGNFISSQTTPPRNASILLNIDLEKTEGVTRIKQVSFVPIWTQFRLPSGEDHFVVRSVYQMLTLPEETQTALLRAKDIARLKDIHFETTKLLLNQDIPLEEIQDEYIFQP